MGVPRAVSGLRMAMALRHLFTWSRKRMIFLRSPLSRRIERASLIFVLMQLSLAAQSGDLSGSWSGAFGGMDLGVFKIVQDGGHIQVFVDNPSAAYLNFGVSSGALELDGDLGGSILTGRNYAYTAAFEDCPAFATTQPVTLTLSKDGNSLAGSAPSAQENPDCTITLGQPAPYAFRRLTPALDVRYASSGQRALSDSENAALQSGLHWSPSTVPVSLGNTVQAQLFDGQNRPLAAIRISWISVEQPKQARGRSYNPSIAHFSVGLDNGTTCVFASSAELRVPGDLGAVVATTDWFAWTSLNNPFPGASKTFPTMTTFGRNATTLELRPSDPTRGALLSQCMTP